MSSRFDGGDAEDASVPMFGVSLRIRGDSLDPDFLTQQFGVAPSFSARKGDRVSGDGRQRMQETGVWSYRLDVPPATDLGEVIALLLEVFPEDSTLWSEITEAYSADVSCVVFLEGELQSAALGAEVMGALARRGLPLSLEIHAPHDGDEDALA